MKKHAEALAAIKSEDLVKNATALREEIASLRKGVRLGEVQNYKMIGKKRRELARVLSRTASEAIITTASAKAAMKKETK